MDPGMMDRKYQALLQAFAEVNEEQARTIERLKIHVPYFRVHESISVMVSFVRGKEVITTIIHPSQIHMRAVPSLRGHPMNPFPGGVFGDILTYFDLPGTIRDINFKFGNSFISMSAYEHESAFIDFMSDGIVPHKCTLIDKLEAFKLMKKLHEKYKFAIEIRQPQPFFWEKVNIPLMILERWWTR
jgi:hypothetical protein